MIKVISNGTEGNSELHILKLFNSSPLRSDARNATVPVLEYLEFGGWTFAVMPYCDESEQPPIRNADEALECTEQILAVRRLSAEHC